MAKRKIINIDEERCNGCGACIPNCPEGALQVIDGKARLISDLFCDGLGTCIGHCPEGAINIEEREAGKYDERKVMGNIVKGGANVIKAHLGHLRGHNEAEYLKEAIDYLKENGIAIPSEGVSHGPGSGGCPGSRVMEMRPRPSVPAGSSVPERGSELRQWPVQLMLVPVNAPYFKGADLLIAADCVPFAYPDFHRRLLRGKALLVGCPKLDDLGVYRDKISNIIRNNDIRSVTYAHMEVPCCFGLVNIIEEAISGSGKNVPFNDVTVGINGELIK